jgi:hypothetical protein
MFRNLSFARQILPALALIGVAIAAWMIVFGLPDRSTQTLPNSRPRRWASLPKGRGWRARGLSSRRAR